MPSEVVYQDKLLLNVKSQKIYKIDIKTLCGDLSQYDWKNQFPYENIDVSASGGTRFVECKDGNLYTVESTNGENNLVKIKPDFTIEKAPIHASYEPSSFGLTSEYNKNLIVRFNATTGEKISEITYDGYYFPATFIFN